MQCKSCRGALARLTQQPWPCTTHQDSFLPCQHGEPDPGQRCSPWRNGSMTSMNQGSSDRPCLPSLRFCSAAPGPAFMIVVSPEEKCRGKSSSGGSARQLRKAKLRHQHSRGTAGRQRAAPELFLARYRRAKHLPFLLGHVPMERQLWLEKHARLWLLWAADRLALPPCCKSGYQTGLSDNQL